jgi:hypothetical protein
LRFRDGFSGMSGKMTIATDCGLPADVVVLLVPEI